jgi:hypothetical protein
MADTWTIDELKALTSEVTSATIKYRGKHLVIQFCELTEAQEPKTTIPSDDLSEEETASAYQTMGYEKVKAMIAKADEMQPDDASHIDKAWDELPSTIRYQISTKVLGGETVDF